MTITERNNKLKHFIACLKCEASGKCCDDNCPTQYDAGNMGEIIENLEAISKALEQEPTTKNDLEIVIDAMEYRTNALIENIKTEIMHFANMHCSGDDVNIYDVFKVIDDCCEIDNPTTKNDLEVDCISRADVLKLMQDNWHTHNGDWAMQESMDDIRALPSVTPQEPRVDFKELKRKIPMEIDDSTDDAWLAYGEVCNRISNAIDEFVSDMRGEEV